MMTLSLQTLGGTLPLSEREEEDKGGREGGRERGRERGREKMRERGREKGENRRRKTEGGVK